MLGDTARSRLRDIARSRGTRRAAGLATLATILLLLGAALTPSRPGRPNRFGVVAVAARTSSTNPLGVRLSKVYGSNVPAGVYGTEIADLEDKGENTRGEMVSELSPLPAKAFARPVAAYKSYAARWTADAERDTDVLLQMLAKGTRADARSAWETAWSAYLHLGAVYGLFGPLNQAIDGTPGGLLRGASDPAFTGFHKIEMGLWGVASPRSLVAPTSMLVRDLHRLHRRLPGVQISPLEYATRAHEILEDAQRDLMSGTQVPWSGQGLLGTAAGLAATSEVFRTLEPLLSGRENTEAEVRSELGLLGSAIASVRRDHSGWPALAQLTTDEHELLDGTLAGALGALELLPGTLETTAAAPIPKLPAPGAAGKSGP
ncbi:MAG: EfeM/EfeO family lipoprotein [Solirubrobacteraceae bacterium]